LKKRRRRRRRKSIVTGLIPFAALELAGIKPVKLAHLMQLIASTFN